MISFEKIGRLFSVEILMSERCTSLQILQAAFDAAATDGCVTREAFEKAAASRTMAKSASVPARLTAEPPAADLRSEVNSE